jgi:hypothetical protein
LAARSRSQKEEAFNKMRQQANRKNISATKKGQKGNSGQEQLIQPSNPRYRDHAVISLIKLMK